jgi:hypothetical protein
MEMVLEQDEVDDLLRQALLANGIRMPREAVMVVRQNHKKGTIRVVFRADPDVFHRNEISRRK